MIYDCIIVGGGPAGLNAALVLGRARRNVLLFDHGKPRNAVSRESHGFLTRDGIPPEELRRLAREELSRYPTVRLSQAAVHDVVRRDGLFHFSAGQGEKAVSHKIILAAGLKEQFPEIPGLRERYGTSLFNCPYCDGWENRDKALVVLAETPALFHYAKGIYNWSRNLVVCTNGRNVLTKEQIDDLQHRKGIPVVTQPIREFAGAEGRLEEVRFADGSRIRREAGFVLPRWVQAAPFGEQLGCRTDRHGALWTDELGRTTVKDVYAAGDTARFGPSQLIIAAGHGSRCAIAVNSDLTEERF